MATPRTATTAGADRAGAVVRSAKRAVARRLPAPAYRLYRKRRVAWEIRCFRSRVVTHSYLGHRLDVLLADPMSAGWYDHDWQIAPEIEELTRVGALRPGARVFDIGAHQAVVALVLAREVGPHGHVVAVEAEPHNASVAQHNVEINGAANLTIVHAAIADEPGFVQFAESLNGHVDPAGRAGTVRVGAVTIDQLAEQYGRPDLVFLDVEGYEGKALAGAQQTLRAGSTSFFVEVHGADLVDCTVQEVLASFRGYAVRAAPEVGGGVAGAFAPLREPPTAGRFFVIATPNSASR